MPKLQRPDGAEIAYDVRGTGETKILLIAPGGMRSCIANWKSQPYDPWNGLQLDKFTVIAMDQRSAQMDGGESRCEIAQGDGWHTFMNDQLAVLDHLGVQKCHTIGSCIGPSYQLQLLRDHPERFGAAVLMQPIGVAHSTTEEPGWEGVNSAAVSHWFGDWAVAMERRGLADSAQLKGLFGSMFTDVAAKDFVFTVTRDEVQQIEHPLLVLMGRDMFHPSETAREIAQLAPNAELIEEWRDLSPEILAASVARIEGFLCEHADLVVGDRDEADAELARMGF